MHTILDNAATFYILRNVITDFVLVPTPKHLYIKSLGEIISRSLSWSEQALTLNACCPDGTILGGSVNFRRWRLAGNRSLGAIILLYP